VCLYQPERRVLLSGDHVLGRVSLYFDYDYTPDPVGEFMASLDKVDALGARLALSGHGRPFTDVAGHVNANRELVSERLDTIEAACDGRSAYDIARDVYGDMFSDITAGWLMPLTLCFLRHLQVQGRIQVDDRTPAHIYTRSDADRRGAVSRL
jgi:glyoxylase-like metal-dependent hydrolase (beta-lactamase superfamily II)